MLIQKIKISNFKTYLSLDLDLTVDDDRPIILIGGSPVMFLAGACIIAFAVPEIHVLTTEQYYGAWLYVPVLGMAL